MKKQYLFLLFIFFLPCGLLQLFADNESEVEEEILFDIPKGWGLIDVSKVNLDPTIKTMVVGKGKGAYPPSINLCIHPYSDSEEQYLKEIGEFNKAERVRWKNLGTIQTQAGRAHFLQVELPTEYGDVRELQIFFKKEDKIFLLTAAALREEFPNFYRAFFETIRSTRFKVVEKKEENK